jgi:predicted DNA-binding transcriptional regulator AlpA
VLQVAYIAAQRQSPIFNQGAAESFRPICANSGIGVHRFGASFGGLLRLYRVVAETGLCVRSIYEVLANGTLNFPISKQARAWASDEIEAWKPQGLPSAITSIVYMPLTLLEHAAEAFGGYRRDIEIIFF